MSQVTETSRQAYYSEIKPTLGERQKLVYGIFSGNTNWTNSEIADYLGIPINTVTPRVFELRKMGLLVEAIKRPCRITGRTAIAWKIKSATLF